jgi:hypothetical protein
MEGAGIEARNPANAAFFGQDSLPKIFAATTDAGNRTNPGDNDTSSAHAFTGLAWPST